MGLLNQRKRVDLGDGEWVEVRPLSIGALRAMRQKAAAIVVPEGEEKEEAQGFELSKLALQACIVAWSDEAPVTPENIDQLPYTLMFKITAAVGLGEPEAPLPTGPTSTES